MWRASCAALLLLAAGPAAYAADSGHSPETFTLSVDRQSLDGALQQLASQCGVQVIYFSRVTEGLGAPAIEGSYTLSAAMERLLSGSGLTFSVINPQTVEVRPMQARAARSRTPEASAAIPAPEAQPEDPLQEIVVVGLAEQLVATRIATPLREIPQSISIVTGEQMRERNDFTLGDVMGHAPGISVQKQTALDEDFYSRGYQITSFHIDGGAAVNPKFQGNLLYLGTPDMVEFDHVEILRGADGLFSGNANPGGTISLVRKRPQRNFALDFSTAAGSWEDRRIEMDITGPIALDGDLRGRAAAVYSRDGYFHDVDPHDKTKVFAAIEHDVTAGATLTAGISYQRDDAAGVGNGLPIYQDGRDPRFPRDTAFEFDWTGYRNELRGAYLQYRQQLAPEWSLKLNASGWRTEAEFAIGDFGAEMDPVFHVPYAPFSAIVSARPNRHKQDTADLTVTGTLDWFGLRQEVAFGADYMRIDLRSVNHLYNFDVLHSLLAFDAREYPDPRLAPSEPVEMATAITADQYGAFASLRIDFDDAWSFIGGARVSGDSNETRQTLTIGPFEDTIAAEYGTDHVVTPYAGLMYAFARHYSLYASYSDIYLAQGFAVPLDPVRGVNMEVGIKGEWRNGALNGSLAVYRIEQENLSRFVAPPPDAPIEDGVFCCFVGASRKSRGVDLELTGELAAGWTIGAGYTYGESDSDAPESYPLPTFAPKHSLQAWTNVRLRGELSRWQIGGGVHAQSETTRTMSPYCPAPAFICTPVSFVQPSFAVLDLRTGFEIDRHWQIALSVNNVLDKNYYESVGGVHIWYGEPLNWMLRIDGRY